MRFFGHTILRENVPKQRSAGRKEVKAARRRRRLIWTDDIEAWTRKTQNVFEVTVFPNTGQTERNVILILSSAGLLDTERRVKIKSARTPADRLKRWVSRFDGHSLYSMMV
ncbi:hypothetical protein PoB_004415500 [Plakobranchus ocellatus]|uniref:Uncharacterized protein n=1 Tax=Plakobranchus ocellatus TaxID=259542 RepID=A0AAV4BAL9_9GAST|nr:hypothetical protein PoB_004415500 [Plakobranchus ocellatus]